MLRAQGFQPPHSLVRTKEPLIGLDFLLETVRSAREFRYLDLVNARHEKYGNTYVARRLLYDTISTRDPENLKHSK